MTKTFTYSIIVVDNETSVGLRLKCPDTGIQINTTVMTTIDAALADLGIPEECLNRSNTKISTPLSHCYDIVLLDFEMDENKVQVDRRVLDQIRTARDFAQAEKAAATLIKTEYPMGALSLLPLYKETFDVRKRGACVIQGYSKVMHERCPKAAAVFEIASNLGLDGGKMTIELSTVEPSNLAGVPIGRLLERRARSVLREVPADCLEELLGLLDCEDDCFWQRPLERIAAWLDCEAICFKDLRPDLPEYAKPVAKEWLRQVLRGRGYAHEARKCWAHPVVQKVAHNTNLAKDELLQASLQVNTWPREEGIVTVGDRTFRLCRDLLDEMREFPVLAELTSEVRRDRLHRMFRMAMSDDPRQGYLLNDIVGGLPQDCYGSTLAPIDIEITKPKHYWNRGYLWVHRKVLHTLLQKFLMIPRFPGGKHQLLCHANASPPAIYFIAMQNEEISSNDAQEIFERARAAIRGGTSWGPFPALNDWGHLELWSNSGPLHHVTSFGFMPLDKSKTIVTQPEIARLMTSSSSAVVMVLPIEEGVF